MTLIQLIRVLYDTVQESPNLGELEVKFVIPKDRDKSGMANIFTYSIDEISLVGTYGHKFVALVLPNISSIILNYTESVSEEDKIN